MNTIEKINSLIAEAVEIMRSDKMTNIKSEFCEFETNGFIEYSIKIKKEKKV